MNFTSSGKSHRLRKSIALFTAITFVLSQTDVIAAMSFVPFSPTAPPGFDPNLRYQQQISDNPITPPEVAFTGESAPGASGQVSAGPDGTSSGFMSEEEVLEMANEELDFEAEDQEEENEEVVFELEEDAENLLEEAAENLEAASQDTFESLDPTRFRAKDMSLEFLRLYFEYYPSEFNNYRELLHDYASISQNFKDSGGNSATVSYGEIASELDLIAGTDFTQLSALAPLSNAHKEAHAFWLSRYYRYFLSDSYAPGSITGMLQNQDGTLTIEKGGGESCVISPQENDRLIRETVLIDGKLYQYDYGTNGKLVSTQYLDDEGKTILELYSADGKMREKRFSDGSREEYVYQGTQLALMKKLDANGSLATSQEYVYGENNSLIRIEEHQFDAGEKKVKTFVYDPDGDWMMTRIWDAAETAETLERVEYPDERIEKYFYSAEHQLSETQFFSREGVPEHREEYSYGARGELAESRIFDAGGTLIRTSRHEYGGDEVLDEITSRDPEENLLAKKNFDASGRALASVRYSPEGSILETEIYSYNAAGLLQKSASSDAEGRLLVERFFNTSEKITQFRTFDEMGALVEKKEFIYGIDGKNGKLTETKFFNGTNVPVKTESYEYGPQGEVIRTTEFVFADGKLARKNVYDAEKHLVEEHLMNEEEQPAVIRLFDSLGNMQQEERNSYGAGGKLETVGRFIPGEGAELRLLEEEFYQTIANTQKLIQKKNYDSLGTVREIQDYAYDSEGRVTSILLSGTEGAVISREQYKYDGQGKLAEKEEFGAGDILKKVSHFREIQGQPALIELKEYEDSEALKKKEVYDYEESSGRLIAISQFDGQEELIQKEEYFYGTGSLFNQIRVSDKDGKKMSEQFLDPSGLTTSVKYYDALGELAQTEEYVYDAAGKPTQINVSDKNSKKIKEQLLNAAGQISETKFFNTEEIFDKQEKYIYDANQILSRIDTLSADGKKLSEQSLTDGRITNAKFFDAAEALSRQENYIYDANGNMIRVDVLSPAGIKLTEQLLNAAGEVTGMNLFDAAGGLEQIEEYVYTADGILSQINVFDRNHKKLMEQVLDAPGKKVVEVRNFDSAELFSGKELYFYDAGGTLTAIHLFDQNGKKLTEQIFDAEGKKVVEVRNFDVLEAFSGKDLYFYGADGLLDRIDGYDKDGKKVIEQEFDAAGTKIAEVRNFDASGVFSGKERYVYGAGGILERVDIFDENNKKVMEQKFDAEGKKVVEVGNFDVTETFTGMERYLYDASGVLDAIHVFDREGKKTAEQIMDESGQKVIEVRNFDAQETFSGKELYFYADGILNAIYVFDKDGKKMAEQKLDAQGRNIEEVKNFDAAGTFSGSELYFYDTDGVIAQIHLFGANNKKFAEQQFDAAGQKVLEVRNFDAAEEFSGSEVYSYGANGILETIQILDKNGKKTAEQTLDAEGKKVAEIAAFDALEEFSGKEVYLYDADGILDAIYVFDTNGKKTAEQIMDRTGQKVIEVRNFDAFEEFSGKELYFYGTDGILDAIHVFNQNGKKTAEQIMDELGKQVIEVRNFDAAEEFSGKELYFYGADGILDTIHVVDRNGKKTAEQIMDEQGKKLIQANNFDSSEEFSGSELYFYETGGVLQAIHVFDKNGK
ncbi:MAG: hypothetical protein HY586_01500, partial [Candidatus Omnitrophica bacterium]|nr:hypothetical protein [Candidatus Omnitrophota bacterium]